MNASMLSVEVQQTAPDRVQLRRVLPASPQRVWSFLTDSGQRALWLAGGRMEPRVGGRVELLFRHADLSSETAPTPERYRAMEDGHLSTGTVTVWEPPQRLGYTWDEGDHDSEVLFELLPQGEGTVLTITHSRLRSVDDLASVAGGWHAHTDILAERLAGREPHNFWRVHEPLEAHYRERFGAG